MLLGVAQLFGKSGLSMPVQLNEQINDTSDYPDVVEFLQPVKIEGTLKNENEFFILDAIGNTAVNLRCDRCIAPVKEQLSFEIKERFAHTGRSSEETETFSGDQIDLADFVRRGIIGALPMKVLCSEDCKGLCPICGKNLNEGACECDTTYIDPRFESLRALFNVDEEV